MNSWGLCNFLILAFIILYLLLTIYSSGEPDLTVKMGVEICTMSGTIYPEKLVNKVIMNLKSEWLGGPSGVALPTVLGQ